MKPYIVIVHKDAGSAYGMTFPDAPDVFPPPTMPTICSSWRARRSNFGRKGCGTTE